MTQNSNNTATCPTCGGNHIYTDGQTSFCEECGEVFNSNNN